MASQTEFKAPLSAMLALGAVKASIYPETRYRAPLALQRCALTALDAFRIHLTRVVNEGTLPLDFVTYSVAHDA